MANPWFRLYAEFAADPKVQIMSEVMQRRLIMLFCLRCSNDLVTLHDDEIAFHLRISNEDMAETKALFVSKGFIDSAWNVQHWEKRQFVSDSSAARVARHREKKRNAPKQPCNVTVTPPDTDTDTDTDTDKSNTVRDDVAPAPAIAPAAASSAGAIAGTLRRAGVTITSQHPVLLSWIAEGLTLELATEALEIARQRKPAPENIAANYLDKIIKNEILHPPAPQPGQAPRVQVAKPWFLTASGIEAKASEIGYTPPKDVPVAAWKFEVFRRAGITEEMHRKAQADFGRAA